MKLNTEMTNIIPSLTGAHHPFEKPLSFTLQGHSTKERPMLVIDAVIKLCHAESLSGGAEIPAPFVGDGKSSISAGAAESGGGHKASASHSDWHTVHLLAFHSPVHMNGAVCPSASMPLPLLLCAGC